MLCLFESSPTKPTVLANDKWKKYITEHYLENAYNFCMQKSMHIFMQIHVNMHANSVYLLLLKYNKSRYTHSNSPNHAQFTCSKHSISRPWLVTRNGDGVSYPNRVFNSVYNFWVHVYMCFYVCLCICVYSYMEICVCVALNIEYNL